MNKKLTEEEKGKIAIEIVRAQLRKRPPILGKNTIEDIKKESEGKVNAELDALVAFYREIIKEVQEETYNEAFFGETNEKELDELRKEVCKNGFGPY